MKIITSYLNAKCSTNALCYSAFAFHFCDSDSHFSSRFRGAVAFDALKDGRCFEKNESRESMKKFDVIIFELCFVPDPTKFLRRQYRTF